MLDTAFLIVSFQLMLHFYSHFPNMIFMFNYHMFVLIKTYQFRNEIRKSFHLPNRVYNSLKWEHWNYYRHYYIDF